VWNNTNNALRVVQSTVDGDFEAEVKFDSLPDSKYQLQGLLIGQDASNFVRMDFFHDGKNLRLFAANFTNGSASVKFNAVIASGSPLYMRVKREGNSWSQSYSYDGQTWANAASFSRALSTSSISIFAGNAGNSPAFTAVVDSFMMY
jgi:regulation of enolase protein 1 (concanavalin A-like superfamily)